MRGLMGRGLVVASSIAIATTPVAAGAAVWSPPTSDLTQVTDAGGDVEAVAAGVQRHLVTRRGTPTFDAAAAGRAGESAQVMEAGRAFNAMAARNAQPRLAKVSLPVWGNWCGPGHSGPGAPVDTLDTLCMRHDQCYQARGYFDCLCDAQLKAEIGRYSDRMSWRERAVAAAITVYFSVTPCKP